MSSSAIKPARALISVSDKTGIVEFAQGLHAAGVELLSTGGTASLIAKAVSYTHLTLPTIYSV